MAHILSTIRWVFLLFFLASSAYAGVEPGRGAPPVRLGGFLLTPKLALEQQYNSNIFADEDDEKGDFITVLKPSIGIEKSIRDHHFQLNAGSEVKRYWDNNSENVENYNVSLDSRITALRGWILPFKLSYDLGHRERAQERSVNDATEPLAFQALNAEAGVEYQPNRMFVGVYGRYGNKRYDNGRTASGAPVIREDGDFESYGGRLALRYETAREWQPFASLSINRNDFERRSFDGVSFSGVARDNTVYRALAGLAFKYKGLLSGNVAVGRDWRNYSEDSIDDVSATAAEALIEWQATEKTGVAFNLLRATQEDNELNEGFVETKAGLVLNHELQSDLFLRARTEYENADFENSRREDDYYNASAGIYYALNPRLQLGADFTQRMRDSNREDASFDQSIFMIRLTGAL